MSILTGLCTPDTDCGSDHWFWVVAFLATLTYAVWYTFKDDIMGFIFFVPNALLKSCQSRKRAEVKPAEESDEADHDPEEGKSASMSQIDMTCKTPVIPINGHDPESAERMPSHTELSIAPSDAEEKLSQIMRMWTLRRR